MFVEGIAIESNIYLKCELCTCSFFISWRFKIIVPRGSKVLFYRLMTSAVYLMQASIETGESHDHRNCVHFVCAMLPWSKAPEYNLLFTRTTVFIGMLSRLHMHGGPLSSVCSRSISQSIKYHFCIQASWIGWLPDVQGKGIQRNVY